jgi:hypothetical protein
MSDVGGLRTEARCPRAEAGGQREKTEVRGPMSEVGGGMPEVGGQMSEVRGKRQRSEVRCPRSKEDEKSSEIKESGAGKQEFNRCKAGWLKRSEWHDNRPALKKILDGRAISAYILHRIPVGSMLPIQRP